MTRANARSERDFRDWRVLHFIYRRVEKSAPSAVFKVFIRIVPLCLQTKLAVLINVDSLKMSVPLCSAHFNDEQND